MHAAVKNRTWSLSMAALTCVFSLIPALSAQNDSPEPQSNERQTGGQNLSNTWSQHAEHSISATAPSFK
jgi:hypothetical protein